MGIFLIYYLGALKTQTPDCPRGRTLGTLGLPWGTPWATMGPPGAPFGPPMAPLGPTLGFQKEPMSATRLSTCKVHVPIVFWSILLPMGAAGPRKSTKINRFCNPENEAKYNK